MPFGAIFMITVTHDHLMVDTVAKFKVESVDVTGELMAPMIGLQECYDVTTISAPGVITREIGAPFTPEFLDAYPTADLQNQALDGLFVGSIGQQVPAYNVGVAITLGNVVCPP